MRISDWSSDVCSSDLQGGVQRQNYLAPDESDRDLTTWRGSVRVSAQLAAGRDVFLLGFVNRRDHRLSVDRKIGRASCRERVCQYVSISVVAVSLKKQKIQKNYT